MPNIMLTYRCNLNCPYCFANEFVNKDSSNITLKNFDKAVSFITKDGPTRLGLIGGEPTLHPEFDKILILLIENPLITEVTIYTNGILLDRFTNLIVHPKFRLLINWNAPNDIGESSFNRIRNNADVFFHDYHMKDRINIGINLYDEKMDYTYLMDILPRYGLHRVRMSLTVPDFSQAEELDVINYFKENKRFILDFLEAMEKINVLPYYDCNKPPYCIWDENEKAWLEAFVKKYKVSESNLIGQCSFCYPVIDILPDLRAVRCFGMSDFEKVSLENFDSVTDIASYFLSSVDALAYKIPVERNCLSCYERSVRRCSHGCMGFKAKRIHKLNDICSSV